MNTQHAPKLIVHLFRRHEDWCKRSGYASMSFAEFKASRMAEPRIRAAIDNPHTHHLQGQ